MSFTDLPDLAARDVGGSVCAANDEFFAARENLILPEPPSTRLTFGHKGKEYDGWETRRRREPGVDWAVVRLGVPGIVRGVVVDTSFFTGNFPPFVSVEAVAAEGYPSPDELTGLAWTTLVERSPARGDHVNQYPVDDDRFWTHVRLTIHPDGGVARFRVHGEPVPDPRFLTGTIDLAALENGGTVVASSYAFYGSATRLILPGRARDMGEGWENARRRDDDNDWVVVRLAGEGVVHHVELDTSYFLGNAPGWVRLAGCRAPYEQAEWFDLVTRRRAQPDTRHRFLVDELRPVTHVRLDVFPDGGMARLRVWGELTTRPAPPLP
ncbi:MAG: allantoicase [Nocardioidaceae bacterium]